MSVGHEYSRYQRVVWVKSLSRVILHNAKDKEEANDWKIHSVLNLYCQVFGCILNDRVIRRDPWPLLSNTFCYRTA